MYGGALPLGQSWACLRMHSVSMRQALFKKVEIRACLTKRTEMKWVRKRFPNKSKFDPFWPPVTSWVNGYGSNLAHQWKTIGCFQNRSDFSVLPPVSQVVRGPPGGDGTEESGQCRVDSNAVLLIFNEGQFTSWLSHPLTGGITSLLQSADI